MIEGIPRREPPAFRARRFGKRHFIRARHAGRAGSRRGAVCGRRSYLFASVIEHFLALYARSTAYATDCDDASEKGEFFGEWTPRAGQAYSVVNDASVPGTPAYASVRS